MTPLINQLIKELKLAGSLAKKNKVPDDQTRQRWGALRTQAEQAIASNRDLTMRIHDAHAEVLSQPANVDVQSARDDAGTAYVVLIRR